MGYQLTVDPGRRRVHISFDDVLTPGVIAELRTATLAHPDFDPAFDQLIDGRGITALRGIGAGTVRQLANNREGVYVPGARRAFVVNSDLKFGLSRIFELLTSQRSSGVRVFRDYDQARHWLDEIN